MVYQDFQNDYNETDVEGRVAATLTKIDWTAMERDDDCWFDRDFGAAFFDDFDIVFDFRLSDVEAGDASSQLFNRIFLLGNDVANNPQDQVSVNLRQVTDTDDVFTIRLIQRTGGVQDYSATSGALAINTTYYARLKRAVATVELDVYSTALLRVADGGGDEVDLDDGGSGDATDYRYCMASTSLDLATDGSDHSTGWIDNLDLAYVPPTGIASKRMLIGVGI